MCLFGAKILPWDCQQINDILHNNSNNLSFGSPKVAQAERGSNLKKYTSEQKQTVLDEICDQNRIETIEQVAKKHNVPRGTIYNWVMNFKKKNPEVQIKINRHGQGKRKTGRAVHEKKYHQIKVWLSEEQKEIVTKSATANGQSVSKYVLDRLEKAPRKLPKLMEEEQRYDLLKYTKEVAELRKHIAKISGNINDTVRWMNYLPVRVHNWKNVVFEKLQDEATGTWIGIQATNHENGEHWDSKELIAQMDKVNAFSIKLRELNEKATHLLSVIEEQIS
jgi:uncharacterized protein (DUF1778 family)